ncbi:MAG: hypothetical protein GF390_02665 [Candidatus Pacebacteria bacterium]|nr:hypothetical protein [Candidatus Paceibacterota bacterium]
MHIDYMETIQEIALKAFAVDSIWSVILRGVIWLAVAIIIIFSVDKADPSQSMKSLKANLGFFLMFLLLSGGLIYWLFGFTSAS